MPSAEASLPAVLLPTFRGLSRLRSLHMHELRRRPPRTRSLDHSRQVHQARHLEQGLALKHAARQHRSQRVLGETAGSHPQRVPLLPPSKPNINSSLNDIIKFVQEKYIARKYADPKHHLEPLKRPKQQQHNTRSQSLQNSHSAITPKTSKETPKAQVKGNLECPFSAFDNIISSKLKQEKISKPAENLISFE